MADYYPLISRAISGLDPSAPGEQRRAIYERARSALIAQLRSVQPPLTESEITRERLSLEEAVRKVESEAAARSRAAREASRANRSKPGESASTASSAAASSSTTSRANATASATPRPQRELRANPPAVAPTPPPSRPQPQPPVQEAPRRADPPPNAPNPNQTQSPGIRGFRDVTADADDLGRAAAQANRSARKTYANVPSPTPEFDRLEPSMEDRGNNGGGYGFNELASDEPAARAPQQMPPVRGRPKKPPVSDRDHARDVRRRAGGGFPLKSAILIGLVMILIGAGFLWGPTAYSSLRAMLKSTSTTTADVPKDGATAPRPKIADRVGQPSEQAAPVAQRVVLYDEDPADPKGKQYVGTVVWRTEQMKGTGGAAGDLAVRGDIDIPERKFKMSMSFRRNTDTSLPASHTAELTFVLPADFSGGGIANVPGILMKSNEQARGTPLAGLAVKVTDGFFLVGLSNVDTDRSRNVQLLKERSWFDVPLVYTNQRRAIIAIEKGAPGERVFNDAFAAWGE